MRLAAQDALGDSAFRTAWDDGAAYGLDAAVAYATRARGRRGRPATGWAGLTPTELAVARLAAQGLRTADVAARLFMKPGTAKTHLANIYAKLHVTNRAQLTTEARRHEP